MLKLYFLTHSDTPLADTDIGIITILKSVLKENHLADISDLIEDADALIIQEDSSYKNFNYAKRLKNDPIFKQYGNKIFTINTDDSGTGLIKGLYTGLHKKRFHPRFHVAVPYLRFPNELILREQSTMTPNYLATWRGNTSSNFIRSKIVELYKNDNSFDIYVTNGRSNYIGDEKRSYVTSLLKAKFSLCPAGFAPVSFRIYESMALGRCPVIIADQFIPPQGPEWETFSIFISEKQIDKIKSILKQNETFYNDLGRKAFENWKKYFSPSNCDRYYVTKLIELIKLSPTTTVQDEVNRWSSISTYYNNKWTLPQRFYNKLSKS